MGEMGRSGSAGSAGAKVSRTDRISGPSADAVGVRIDDVSLYGDIEPGVIFDSRKYGSSSYTAGYRMAYTVNTDSRGSGMATLILAKAMLGESQQP